jgi:hypothetical protein
MARRQRSGPSNVGINAVGGVGNGLSAALAARNGQQPHHRERILCGGSRHPHRGRWCTVHRPQPSPFGHPTLPARYEQLWPLRSGGCRYTIGLIHPVDAQLPQKLVQSFSSESRAPKE